MILYIVTMGYRFMVAINILRYRPLRKTCSAYPPSLSALLSPYADEEIICWGTLLNFFAFLVGTFCTRYMPVHDAASGLCILERGALGICMSSVCT